MNKVAIITGGSKGIGKALVDIFIEKEYIVFSIARSHQQTDHQNMKAIQADLVEIDTINALMDNLFSEMDLSAINEIVLINNAGMIGPVGNTLLENIDDLKKVYDLNIIAPTMLSRIFIHKLKNSDAKKTIVSISSGAAANPIKGWAAYCSTKAALDMLTRVIALEQAELENGVRTIAVYPGIVDTAMQVEIRSTSKEHFADVDRFIKFKENGELLSARDSAEKIVKIYMDPAVENGTLIRVS